MYFCHVRCYASSSGQKLDSWFEASGAKFGWGSIQLFPRACGGGDRSWWQDMAEAQWGPPLPPPPPPQHSPVPPSGNGTAWNEVLSLRPSPKPQVFQKQARKHFIRLYETLSQTRDSRVQPERRVLRAGGGRSCPGGAVSLPAPPPGPAAGTRHIHSQEEKPRAPCASGLWPVQKDAVTPWPWAGLAGSLPLRALGPASSSEECAFLTPRPQTVPRRPQQNSCYTRPSPSSLLPAAWSL